MIMTGWRRLGVAAALAWAVAPGLGSAQTNAADGGARPAETLTLDRWLDWERATDPRISPNGEQIVYARSSVDKYTDRWVTRQWIMRADGSRPRELVEGRDPRWSPDSTRLAYVAEDADGNAQLFVRWVDDGATSQITWGRTTPQHIAWSPDGKRLAFVSEVAKKPSWTIDLPRPEGAEWTPDPAVIDTLHYRRDRQGPKTGYDHLFVVPATGGTPRQITEGPWDVEGRPQWRPDGSEILFAGQPVDDPDAADPWTAHILAVSPDGGAVRQLTAQDGGWGSPRVSPDGQAVLYSGAVAVETNYRPTVVRAMDIDGGNDRLVVEGLANAPRSLMWAPDGKRFYFTLAARGRTQIHEGRLDGGHEPVTEGMHSLTLTAISDGGVAVGHRSAPQATTNIYRLTLKRRADPLMLTDVNADILDGVALGTVEEFTVGSSDDARVQGWIVTPPDYDAERRYPLLLAIHGGPHAMYGVNFRPMFQLFTGLGYVVVYANPRGSTGYGSDFANAIDNRYPGRRDFDDLMAATDAAIERRSIDTDRMFVQGCSGGGVLTAWTVINTDRFAAAASRCPVINWISFAGTADIAEWAYTRFRPDFFDDPTRWLDHSPIMHADRVTTPTLLMTGVRDLRTPLAQAEEFYAALKRRGVATKLIPMNDEWHGTSRKPSNMLRTVLYMDKWFREHSAGWADAAPDGPQAGASGAGQ
ncbi:hypothetical protein CCR85_14440 [Rhodothalassium salexigens]|nr:hypothetical protein [Rhodothalassium salexigens]MBK5920258.1 hypothetical protein [Rhodothalassium salexigens]